MIPKLFVKDYPYPHYSQHPNNAQQMGFNAMLGADYIAHQHQQQQIAGRVRAHSEMQANSNIDSLLQVHRRKMQRRAANRRSAQLSRARKKAHLEELKIENARLQRLVDVMESQPELLFCITSTGKITHISELTISFIKINATAEGSLEDPTHLSQILSKESADSILQTISQLNTLNITRDFDGDQNNVLFSSKKVYFRDMFGQPLVGFLRCTKVVRRATLQEMQATEVSIVQQDNISTNGTVRSKTNHLKTAEDIAPHQCVNNLGIEEWNMTNFKILTDCVSSLAPQEVPLREMKADLSSKEGEISSEGTSKDDLISNSSAVESLTTTQIESVPADPDAEFVCVIRTSEAHFVPLPTRKDIFVFSTQLSAESISVHDKNSGACGRRSPFGSSDSHHSSNKPPSSSLSGSENEKKGESETASDDIAHDY